MAARPRHALTVSAFAVRYEPRSLFEFHLLPRRPRQRGSVRAGGRRFVTGARVAHDRIAMWKGRPVETRLGLQIRRDDIGRVGLYATRARQRLSTVREDAVGAAERRRVPSERPVDVVAAFGRGLRGDGSRFDVEADRAVNSGSDAAAIVSPKASASSSDPGAGRSSTRTAGSASTATTREARRLPSTPPTARRPNG